MLLYLQVRWSDYIDNIARKAKTWPHELLLKQFTVPYLMLDHNLNMLL